MAIAELLPAEAYVLPNHLHNCKLPAVEIYYLLTHYFSLYFLVKYLNNLREGEKITESMKEFFEHRLVKALYDLMESNQYKIIRSYRNDIAHFPIEDFTSLKSIAENLARLIPEMPKREASVITAINQKLTLINQLFKMSNELSK